MKTTKGNVKKHITAVIAAMACTMALSMTAFAAPESSRDTTLDHADYGYLRGTINSSGYLTASVERNPDNAYLVLGGTQVSRTGVTLVTQQNVTSDRGQTFCRAHWSSINPNAYTLFGVHGVQGGSRYNAYAVYTSTSVNR